MAKWFYHVESNCSDPTREAEFNEWYNNTHLPDVLETPGFVKATRYELTQPVEGKSKYVAIYEIDTEDLDGAMAALRDTVRRKAREGRMSDLASVTYMCLYKQTSSYPE